MSVDAAFEAALEKVRWQKYRERRLRALRARAKAPELGRKGKQVQMQNMRVCEQCGERRFDKTFQNPDRPKVCKWCDDVKLCNGCGKLLPKSEFYRDYRSRDGRKSTCKAHFLKKI